MSKIKVAQLNLADSELKNLGSSESENIVGGSSYLKLDWDWDWDFDFDLDWIKPKYKVAFSGYKKYHKFHSSILNKGKFNYYKKGKSNYSKSSYNYTSIVIG